jgi:hypothetical protein
MPKGMTDVLPGYRLNTGEAAASVGDETTNLRARS